MTKARGRDKKLTNTDSPDNALVRTAKQQQAKEATRQQNQKGTSKRKPAGNDENDPPAGNDDDGPKKTYRRSSRLGGGDVADQPATDGASKFPLCRNIVN